MIERSLRQEGRICQEASLRVPVAKHYRVHVEQVMAERPRGDEGAKQYPNLLEALGDLVKGGEVGRLWGEMDKKLARIGELRSEIKETEVALQHGLLR